MLWFLRRPGVAARRGLGCFLDSKIGSFRTSKMALRLTPSGRSENDGYFALAILAIVMPMLASRICA